MQAAQSSEEEDDSYGPLEGPPEGYEEPDSGSEDQYHPEDELKGN
jgi:hypothetical protein